MAKEDKMGKLFDYCMTGNWEKTQRIALYKKIEEALENKKLNEEDLNKIEEIINKTGGKK